MKKKQNCPDPTPLRLLLLEDSPADAELVACELQRAGIAFSSKLVKAKKEFIKALSEFLPQVILSDFKLPGFDGLAALEIARLQVPDTPFIFVSGSIGEEKAIELLAQGASDYILKDNLARLGPAVKRVVEEALLKLEKKIAEEELRLHVAELRQLAEAAERFVDINDLDKIYRYLAQSIGTISGADYLMLSLYDDKLQALRPKITSGLESFREIIRQHFCVDLMQMVFHFKDMRREEFRDFVSRRLVPVRDGLYGLCNRKFPRAACRTVEKLLTIDSMYQMGFSWENQLFGGFSLWFKKGNELKNPALIEALANQAAVSIKRLLAEQSLRESEAKYRLIAENTAETISVLDLDLKFTYVSPSIIRLRGFTVEESLNQTMQQTLTPDSLARIQAVFLEEMALEATGKANPKRSRTLELQEYCKDGSVVWVENSMSFLRNDQGQAIGFLAVSKDISERKRAEEQNRYQAELLQNVSDAIIATNQNNNIQVWNKAAERIYGWKAEEVIGRMLHDVLKPEYPYQSREEVMSLLEKEGVWSGEITHHLRDGRQIPVHSTITILNDADGNRSGVVSVNHDISERKRAEEMLLERDQLLKNLTAQVPGMVYTFMRKPDGTYRIPYTSNAIRGIFGVSPQDVVEDAAAIFKPMLAEDRPAVVASIENSALTLTTWQAEYRVQLPGQPVRWMLGQSDPIRLADGSILWYGFNTDITERKQAEELIRASLQEKEVLLQEIHHRVKNNLQIISGLLTLQANQASGKSLDEIFCASQDRIRSIALIHEKLYRSHNLAEIAFDEYLRTLIESLFTTYAIAADRITLQYEMEPILFTIEKAIPLGLIVNELITNALKHAFPEGRRGKIRIALQKCRGTARRVPADRDQPPCYELIIADDGIGLPSGQILEQRKSLGMNLVFMLARQLQAELKVNSGPGAEFRLVFPGLMTSKDNHEKNHGA